MKQGSLEAAARERGRTPSSASKRLAALALRLGVRWLHCAMRCVNPTSEGEAYLAEGTRVLAERQMLARRVAGSRALSEELWRVSGAFRALTARQARP